MKLRWTAAFFFFGFFLFAASPLAAHNFGKLTGIVADPAGNPQMGAAVWLTPGSMVAQRTMVANATTQRRVSGSSRFIITPELLARVLTREGPDGHPPRG